MVPLKDLDLGVSGLPIFVEHTHNTIHNTKRKTKNEKIFYLPTTR